MAKRKRGKREMREFKELLLALRARLQGDVDGLADSALNTTRKEASGDLSSMPIHMADIGSDSYEQEFTLRLLENEEETLAQVEAALERFDEGSYGLCLECGQLITKERLRVIPYTPLCIKCASKREGGR